MADEPVFEKKSMSADPLKGAAHRFFGPDYINNPVAWSKDEAGVDLWSAQQVVANSVAKNRYTAVQACHDSGKSFLASDLAGWWIDTHPIGTAFVVSTAPTAPQVDAILWREIRRLHRKAKLPGRILGGAYPQWKINDELVGYGRKPADYDDSGFQGIHDDFVLVIVDEAGGIPKSLWTAVDTLATNEFAKVLAIGNPDDPTAVFREICAPDSGWNVITIDGLRTPNMKEEILREEYPALYEYFIENDIPFSSEVIPDYMGPKLLSPKWVEERLQRWGPKSSLWMSKVRGEFPTSNVEGVIPLGWVVAAQNRWTEYFSTDHQGEEPAGQKVFGVDVAREGDDESAIATRQGHVCYDVEKIGQQSTMDTANEVRTRLQLNPMAAASIDVIGVGAGVYDRLVEQGFDAYAFNAAAGTTMKDKSNEFGFANVRAAAMWHLRELLDPSQVGGSEVCIPPDEDLLADLTTPKYWVKPGAKIQVEDKKQIRKRLGRSPDKGDAVIIAFWMADDGNDENASAVFEPYQDNLNNLFAQRYR